MNYRDSKILISEPETDTVGVFSIRFPKSFNSDGKDSLALTALNLYYSWFNVESSYKNKKLAYKFAGVQYDIELEDGFYTVEDLNFYLQLKMRLNNHYLVDGMGNNVYYLKLQTNPTYYAITLTAPPVPSTLPTNWANPGNMSLSGNSFQLIVNSAWGNLIGFSEGSYPTTSQTTIYQQNSNKIPQISPITTILVKCDLIGNYEFSSRGDVLDQFSPNKEFGSYISYNPPVIIHQPIRGGLYEGIRISFTDQNGSPLRMRDKSDVLIALSLKRPVVEDSPPAYSLN